jgi:maltose/maltodextrin transport system substrate-binding protein
VRDIERRRVARRPLSPDPRLRHHQKRNTLMKRLITLAVAAATLALSGAALAVEPGKLTIWINGDKGYNGLAEVGKRFTAETGVPVEVSHPDNVEQRFQQVASSGGGPDIMFWAHDRFGEWSKGGLLWALNPSPEVKAKIDDLTWEAVTIDGKIYGYPWRWRRCHSSTTRT